MNGSLIRQSIVRNNILPTVDKGTQIKKEITWRVSSGIELNLAYGFGLSQLNISSSVRTSSIN